MNIDYSIIIPAYNEAAMLGNTINKLKTAMQSVSLQGEIIVADNNSTDNTAEIARRNGATVVFEPINQISRARNTGARAARGEMLIFVDADTTVPPDLLKQTLENLQRGDCCGGGAMLTTDSKVPVFVKMVLGFWNWISRSFKVAAGCYVYARKDDYERSGGFSETMYATEEVWFCSALKRAASSYGRTFKVITEPKVETSARKLHWFGHGYQLMLLLVLMVFPYLMRYKWACGYWYNRPQSEKQN